MDLTVFKGPLAVLHVELLRGKALSDPRLSPVWPLKNFVNCLAKEKPTFSQYNLGNFRKLQTL